MEKYKSPELLPTPFESELLGILAEECAEVIQRAIKIQRFGLMEVQPGQPLNNRDRLSEELGQLLYMMEIADRFGLLDDTQGMLGKTGKLDALKKYMQNEPPGGWESLDDDEE